MMRQRWGLGTVLGAVGVIAALVAACAGSDIPPIDNTDRDALASAYGDEVGAAGAGGSVAGNGSGGSAVAGGAGAGNSGAAGAGPVGGAAGGGVGGSGSDANVCNAPETVLVPTCGGIGCHNANSPFGEFGADAEAAEAFVDVSGFDPACGLFIDSASPEDSLLLTKVQNTQPADCGQRMPLNGDFLDAEQEACLLSWLNQFAN